MAARRRGPGRVCSSKSLVAAEVVLALSFIHSLTPALVFELFSLAHARDDVVAAHLAEHIAANDRLARMIE